MIERKGFRKEEKRQKDSCELPHRCYRSRHTWIEALYQLNNKTNANVTTNMRVSIQGSSGKEVGNTCLSPKRLALRELADFPDGKE